MACNARCQRNRFLQGITPEGLAADPNAQRSLRRLNAAVKSKDNWFGVLLDQIRTYTSPLQLAASQIKDTNLRKAALSEELVGRGAASYYTGGISENAFNLADRRRPRSERSSPAARRAGSRSRRAPASPASPADQRR